MGTALLTILREHGGAAEEVAGNALSALRDMVEYDTAATADNILSSEGLEPVYLTMEAHPEAERVLYYASIFLMWVAALSPSWEAVMRADDRALSLLRAAVRGSASEWFPEDVLEKWESLMG